MPKRQLSGQYINFGFIELKKKGEFVPQFAVCMKTLSNVSMKPSHLQCHLQTNHLEKKIRLGINFDENFGLISGLIRCLQINLQETKIFCYLIFILFRLI